MTLSTTQRKALEAGISALVHAPAAGAYRRRSGEVDGVKCFSGQTLRSLAAKGLLAAERGGFVTTEKGQEALGTPEPSLGCWDEAGMRNAPRGAITWTSVPKKLYTAVVDKSILATVRNKPGSGWLVRMPGFQWSLEGEAGMPIHKRFKITSSPVRAFKTSALARRAVETAHAELPATDMHG